MLNPFPSLLAFSFFAPLIIRAAAAGTLFALAYLHAARQEEIKNLLEPLAGALARALTLLLIAIEAVVAIFLLIGLDTQYAAIAGSLLALRSLVLRPAALSPFRRSTDWLLFALCLSLLLSGAGAYAFDLPL